MASFSLKEKGRPCAAPLTRHYLRDFSDKDFGKTNYGILLLWKVVTIYQYVVTNIFLMFSHPPGLLTSPCCFEGTQLKPRRLHKTRLLQLLLLLVPIGLSLVQTFVACLDLLLSMKRTSPTYQRKTTPSKRRRTMKGNSASKALSLPLSLPGLCR